MIEVLETGEPKDEELQGEVFSVWLRLAVGRKRV